jgi:hypothetical protein
MVILRRATRRTDKRYKKIFVGNPDGKRSLGKVIVGGMTNIKWILKMMYVVPLRQ